MINYSEEGAWRGGISLYFTSPPQFDVFSCIEPGPVEFPTELPAASNKIWRIILPKTSDTRLVIHCNDRGVVNMVMSNTTCSSSNWMKYWGKDKDVERILFRDSDSASDLYSFSLFTPGNIVHYH